MEQERLEELATKLKDYSLKNEFYIKSDENFAICVREDAAEEEDTLRSIVTIDVVNSTITSKNTTIDVELKKCFKPKEEILLKGRDYFVKYHFKTYPEDGDYLKSFDIRKIENGFSFKNTRNMARKLPRLYPPSPLFFSSDLEVFLHRVSREMIKKMQKS